MRGFNEIHRLEAGLTWTDLNGKPKSPHILSDHQPIR